MSPEDSNKSMTHDESHKVESDLQLFTLKQAEAFVGAALREATPEDMRGACIDGRYEPGSGAIAMAGGDAGLLAIGPLLQKSSEEKKA